MTLLEAAAFEQISCIDWQGAQSPAHRRPHCLPLKTKPSSTANGTGSIASPPLGGEGRDEGELKAISHLPFSALWGTFEVSGYCRLMEPLLDRLARQKPVRMVFETIRNSDKQDRVLKSLLIRSAIVAVLLAEIWSIMAPRMGPSSPEMVHAVRVYLATHSANAEAAMDEQIQRESSRQGRSAGIWLGLILFADVTVVYFFWNFGTRKSPLDKALEPTAK